MKTTVKVGVICALSWIAIKYIFFALDLFPGQMAPTAMLNILGLLSAISIGLYIQKRRDTMETNALFDMKNAMSAGLPYVLIVSSFLYLFYTQINPEFVSHQIAEGEATIEKMIKDPKQMDKFRKENPDAEVMTDKQIEKRLKVNNKKGAAPGFTATLSILALLLLATLYSLLVTMIYRQIVFRAPRN
jgi:hypothetical protein